MSQRFALVLTILVLSSGMLYAQSESEENTFNLQREGSGQLLLLEEEEEAALVPQIDGGNVEASVTLGFSDLGTVLFQHEQIIYKYTEEATFWGDVTLTGESAFNPILRTAYNVTDWLALESQLGITFSKYYGAIENPGRRINEPRASPDVNPPEVGEFDAETRSVVSGSAGLNLLYYVFDHIAGNSEGRFHPFLAGGLGQIWYGFDSNYTESVTSSRNYYGSAGLRIITDKHLSIRMEINYNHHVLDIEPSQYFDVLNEGILQIPLNEFPEVGGQQAVESFASHTIDAVGWSIGVMTTF